MPTEAELAWLAALIDGEGSVMLTNHAHSPATIKRQPHLAKYPRIRAIVSIYNTQKPLLDKIEERFGGTIYTHNRPEKENHKATAYSWRMTADMMRDLLPSVLPWLIVKHEQAQLLIRALELKDELTPRKGIEWVRSETAYPKLKLIQEQISSLNRKGRHVTNVVSQLP